MSHLSAMFDPRTVAVIGAGLDPFKTRGRFLHNLKISGFSGKVYPVHPKHTEIQGLRSYPSVLALPEPVDLAMIAIPAEHLREALTQCGDAGTKSAVVFSGIPAGDAGQVIQADLARIAREKKIRLLGPNCLGFFSPFNRMAATFAPLVPGQFQASLPGERRVAIITQSGGTGLHLFQMCHEARVHVVHVMMPGNEADVDVIELLDHVLEQGAIDLVLLFIEGVASGQRFVEVAAKAAGKSVPIVVMKTGRSRAGSRAALSHTAHLTGSDASYEAVFHRYGVIRVWDSEEMVAVARVLSRRSFMNGPNVAVVSSQGGIGGTCADLCEANGLHVPPLSPEVQQRLGEVVPDYGSTLNPVDTGTTVDDRGERFCKTIRIVRAADEVHAVFAILNLGVPDAVAQMKPYLMPLSREAAKPVIFHSAAIPDAENLKEFAPLGFDLLSLRDTIRATSALHAYSAFRRRPLPSTTRSAPRTSHRHSRGAEPACVDWSRRTQLLSQHRIPMPPEALARDEDAAVEAASSMGYPVALKIESADILHKTEAGGVTLGIGDEAALRAAYRTMSASALRFAPKARIDGVLVQRMAAPGHELIVGMMTDDDFGPMMMVGFGGTFAEILKDVVLSPAPVDEATASDMVSRLRGVEILRGARGQKPADIKALAELLTKLSRLVQENPEIAQIDLNPVFVYPEGAGVCAVDALLLAEGAISA